MATPKVFHISLDSPDNTPFPSFPNKELGNGKNGKTDNITLLKIRQRCNVLVTTPAGQSYQSVKLTFRGNRSKKYKFSADGKNAVSDDVSLDYYISVTPEVIRCVL